MEYYEYIMKNKPIADEFNGKAAFHPMGDEKEIMVAKTGSWVLLHCWENETHDGSTGYDTWEIARWFEKGTVVNAGYEEAAGTGEADRLYKALFGKEKKQEIKERGFYWQDDDSGEWYKIDGKFIDCYMVLPRLTKLPGNDVSEEPKEKAAPDEGVFDGFSHSFRLADGTKLVVRTMNKEETEYAAKDLGKGRHGLKWELYSGKDEDVMLDNGTVAVITRKADPEEEKWETEEIAEEIARYVMTKELGVEDPNGLYDLIE